MNVEIGAEAGLFPKKEYISGISLQCGPAPPPWYLKFSKSSNMTNNIVFYKYFNEHNKLRIFLCWIQILKTKRYLFPVWDALQ